MTSSATADIAEYVVGMQFTDIPELASSRAKTAILDTIGVTLAGSRLAAGRMMMDYVEGAGATGVATVFASNQKSTPELAALANGFTADPNILTTRRGYVEALSYPETRDMTKVAAGLRSYFHLVEKGIRIKPYPACTGTHQFIETMRYLCREHDLLPTDVESITVSRISGQTTKRDFPTTELECKFSPAFLAIATLIDGQVTLDNCTQEFLVRPDVQNLLGRTTYVDSASGFIRVVTHEGATFESASRPVRDLLVPDESLIKFFECAEPIVGKEKAARIHEIVGDLENLRSVRELTALLTPRP